MNDPLPSIAPYPDGRIVRNGRDVEIQISGDALARELSRNVDGQRDQSASLVRAIARLLRWSRWHDI